MQTSLLQSAKLVRLVLLGLMLVSLRAPGLSAESAPTAKNPGKKAIVYKIRAGDRLGVRVFQEEELTSTPRVDSKGMINLPLVQELRVDGLTINEAERMIENAYREGRFLRKPQVNIIMEEYGPREVTIGGSIKIPARYPLPTDIPMTLLELVSKAGGFTDTARGTAVRVTRIQPDGSVTTLVFDVESILKGRKDARAEDSSLTLEPNDIVYVPERII